MTRTECEVQALRYTAALSDFRSHLRNRLGRIPATQSLGLPLSAGSTGEAFPQTGPYRFAIFDHDSRSNADVVAFWSAKGLRLRRTSVRGDYDKTASADKGLEEDFPPHR